LLYNVSKVSIIEAKNKAMLVINIPVPTVIWIIEMKLESKYGKEWLKLRINPAINKHRKVIQVHVNIYRRDAH